jgi:putative endonuclease
MKDYYTYITSNYSRVLYVGITDNLELRINQHKTKEIPGFTSRYNLTRLVYFEHTNDAYEAIVREKQLKNMSREKKLALIESVNPTWKDLSEDWNS